MSNATSKRTFNVMLRLTPGEHADLASAMPQGEELASFARRRLLEAIVPTPGVPPIREVAAFIVAALSNDIQFDEATRLFDEHVQHQQGATGHGIRD